MISECSGARRSWSRDPIAFRRAARAAPANYQNDQRAQANDNADHLRGGKTGQSSQAEQVAARIVSHKLHRETNDSIEDAINKNDMTVELFSFVQPQQKKKTINIENDS